MKRTPFFGMLLLIPAVCMMLVVGCKTEEKKTKTETTVAKSDNTAPAGKIESITTAPEATVKGKVKFKGTPPEPTVDSEIAKNKEGPACLSGPMIDKQVQRWIVGKEGGVADVVISLAPPKGKKFDVTEKLKEPFKTPVTVHQPFCAYRPHVIGVLAMVQPIIYTNEFKFGHNVKIAGAPLNVDFDQIVSPGDKKEKTPFEGGEKIYTAVCSIHTFMNGKIAVFTHPYFAVTNDKGEFEIKNVPVDTELTVYMWHESMPEKVEQKKMSFKKGDNPAIDLEITGK